MNDDRISEVYKGEIWAAAAQERARRRIHWMISEVTGDRVLDLGCSQGIASILLGREGFEVVGIDVQASRVEYANNDLKKETESTRARVSFQVGEGGSLDFDDGAFDSVVLGEVIEHLAAPGRLLDEVARVLKAGGRLVLTTPFGVLHHHDHKQTFYPDDLFGLLSQRFAPVSAEVEDRYFRIVCQKGVESSPGVLDSLRLSAFDAVRGIQEELASTRTEVNRASGELEKASRKIDQLSAKLEAGERSKRRIEEAWRKSKSEAQRSRRELADLKQQYASVSSELKRTTEQARLTSRTAEELARVRQRLTKRERDILTLRYRIEVRDWKLESLRHRRWWRLGGLLGEVRRRPWVLPLVPFKVLKLLRTPPPKLPRPVLADLPSPTISLADSPSGERAAKLPGLEDAPAVVPARDVAVLALLDGELHQLLAHEIQIFEVTLDEWASQLDLLHPSMLMLQSGPMLPDADETQRLLETARDRGVRCVLWDTDPASVPLNLRSGFDVIVGDGKPMEDYEGRLIERAGLIQPAIHNPVEAGRREDTARLDVVNSTIGELVYRDSKELVQLAKSFKVIRSHQILELEETAAVLASATPLIVVAPDSEAGLAVTTEEEADVLERGLLRSEVLRGRYSHVAMREIMRHHAIGGDVGRLLETEQKQWPKIDVMVATKRMDKLDTIFENLARQTYPNFSLTLAAHGIAVDSAQVADLANRTGVDLAGTVHVDESVVLGEVFNIGFGTTQAGIVAKMDDDDFYGPEYLWDLYTALDFSGAEVAGKWAHYVYLEGVDSIIYRFAPYEHRFTDVVAISTLLMRREVFEAERFPAMPWGSGSVFLRALGGHGAKVFAADRWNYLYIRGQNGDRNTFPISDTQMLANSDVVCRGLRPDEVVL